VTKGYSIELLDKEQVLDNWGVICPLLEASVVGNAISATDMDAGYILRGVLAEEAVIFACRRNGDIEFVIAFEFSTTNGHKCADLIAMSGKYLVKFRNLYWAAIIDWLRASDVRFLDTMVAEEHAKVYLSKFGFDHSCTILRKELSHG